MNWRFSQKIKLLKYYKIIRKFVRALANFLHIFLGIFELSFCWLSYNLFFSLNIFTILIIRKFVVVNFTLTKKINNNIIFYIEPTESTYSRSHSNHIE